MSKVTQYDQADWKVFNAANDILDLRIWTVRWPAEAGKRVLYGRYFIVRSQVLRCVRLMNSLSQLSPGPKFMSCINMCPRYFNLSPSLMRCIYLRLPLPFLSDGM